MLVRVQMNFPATGEVLAPYAIGHFVAGCMRGSHQMPLMPVTSNMCTSYFDGPPVVSCTGFCIHNGKLTEPIDCFAQPFWKTVRDHVSIKAIRNAATGFCRDGDAPNVRTGVHGDHGEAWIPRQAVHSSARGRCARAGVKNMRLLRALFPVLILFLRPCDVFAQKIAPHTDPYMRAPANESPLAKEVRFTLLTLPLYGVFDDLGYNVNGGAVTLVGQVRMTLLKKEAGKAVKAIPGVSSVANNIEVLPVSPSDDTLRRTLDMVIYSDPVLSVRYAYLASPRIHIIVKNGAVRLEGTVDSEQDKSIAGTDASGVRGVSGVENDLIVEGQVALQRQ